MKKIKACFCQVVDKYDYEPGFMPLAFPYLKSSIDKYNIEIEFTYTKSEIPDEVKDIVLISSLSQDWDQAIDLIKIARKKMPNAIIIVGGQHISQLPEQLPTEANFAIRGEGEVVLPELLIYLNQQNDTTDNYKKMCGLVWHDQQKGKILFNPPNKVNTESIPLPDRMANDGKKHTPYLLTSRGCPYKCTFCSSSAFWKNVRMFSPIQICNELNDILNIYPDLRQISIWDDLFIADKKRLYKLLDEMNKRQLLGKLAFSCNVRADILDDEMCKIMQAIGVGACGFGFESGSDRILKKLKPQGSISVSKNIEAVHLLAKYEFKIGLSMIIGVPEEKEIDVLKTYDITLALMKSGAVSATAYNILTPFPGTYFWKEAVNAKLINPNEFNWTRLKYYADYINSSFQDFNEWKEARIKNNSIYINENYIPEQILFKIMEDKDNIRSKIIKKNCV
ncbi:MAG: B12-binding domain-containing radical SAM protein [Desulfomicrobium sp.]|nr:B12-binding domain-containing radical SAM protein [Pseudomonadota bacterium]MBU4594993.1 B12-binding domain-containing radical SAM protein [Pseudomonadota bacterium]MBV1711223.1 B12-binding domain-containing radical SAM protein [Desulfomicrobium sp.]MBV1746877.1 B12-binding domain-containing radical SAM protein [Desulfomicrobium sp.]